MSNDEPIYTQEIYHKRICEIWEMVKNEPGLEDICKKGAFAQDTLNPNSILFLGVGASNPDSKTKGRNKIKTCEIVGDIQYETEEMCIAAVKQDDNAIEFVPEHLLEKVKAAAGVED